VSDKSLRGLTRERIEELAAISTAYIETHGTITNRELRRETGITYDQAILFFNQMLAAERLVRSGRSSSTKYKLPSAQ
jgi:hypothetical protein